MKKLMTFVLAFLLCLQGAVAVYAAEEINLLEIIRQNTAQETRTYLTNAHPYRYKALDISLAKYPILTRYRASFTSLCDKTVPEIYDMLNDEPDGYEGGKAYVVFDKAIHSIGAYDPRGDIYFDYSRYGDPYFKELPWIDDIVKNNIPAAVRQSDKKLKDILYVDNSIEPQSAVLYFVMEDGSFTVRFYGYNEQGKTVREFEESEFRTYGKAYEDYLISLNYDENGNFAPKDGCTYFLSFVDETPFETLETVSVPPLPPLRKADTKRGSPWVRFALAYAFLALACAAAFCVSRKKE